jgi:WD40 repeat protein
LWQVETANLLLTLPSHNDAAPTVFKLLFSPDSKTLVSAASDVRLWRVRTGELLQTLGNGGAPLAFSPDGTRLATVGYEALYILDIGSGKIEHTLATRWISALAFSPTGDTLVSGGGDDPPQLWNLSTGKSLGGLNGFGDGIWDIVVSPDGAIFTTHRKGNFLLTGETSNGIRVWDVNAGQVTRTIGPAVPALRLALSANGRVLASVEHEGVYNTGENPVRVWEVATGEQIQTLGPYSLDLPDLALSPDGRLANVASRVHDVQTGKTRYDLNPDLREIRDAVFSLDGKTLAYTLDNGIVKLVEAETGELRYLLSTPARYFNNGLTFSPDSKILAVGYEEGLIYLWDTNAGANLQVLTVDGNQVTSLAFSPDGTILASSAQYNSLITQLWDSQTGQLLRNIDTSQIGRIHFTADGKLLVLLRLQDGVVQLWGIPPK